MSLTNNLNQNSFLTPSIELAVENLLPGAEIQPPVGYRHDHLPAHNLALEVGVAVVLAGAVVAVAGDRRVGGQP